MPDWGTNNNSVAGDKNPTHGNDNDDVKKKKRTRQRKKMKKRSDVAGNYRPKFLIATAFIFVVPDAHRLADGPANQRSPRRTQKTR